MVKLEMNKQLQGAVRRAAQIHNTVKLAGQNAYTVISGHSREAYRGTLRKGVDGFAWAWCNCPAGQKSMVCHHIISAGWVHTAICKMRKS
ncbi:MAG: hypothetical protein JNM09_06800 [Blastocatellia bacterium]|nr:hypothetical protein [Blastocatellia bacterium]